MRDRSFEFVWELYDKKVGPKDRIKKKWDKLSVEEKEKAVSYIPRYKEAQPDKQFRKNFETFINNKGWNDEIINYGRKKTPASVSAIEKGARDYNEKF